MAEGPLIQPRDPPILILTKLIHMEMGGSYLNLAAGYQTAGKGML